MPILISCKSSPSAANAILHSSHKILTGAENFTMPDDLDPTTARLVAELAASMLPALTKALASAVPAGDFAGAAERMNRTATDLRNEITKAMRSGIDDSRAGRSIIMQSLGTLTEEILSLRKSLDRMPDILQSGINSINIQPQQVASEPPENVMNMLDEISSRIDALTQGVKAFFETYAEQREIDGATSIPISQAGINADVISGLEGLIKAEGKTHSKELEELSREISALVEENNTALVHEVREAVSEEIAESGGVSVGGNGGGDDSVRKLARLAVMISGACLVMTVINAVILLFK